MKKKPIALITLAALVSASIQGVTANAEVSLAECDRCFQTTINAVLDEDDVGANTIQADRKPLYDLNLNELGYVYEYEIAAGEGYAVVICDEGQYVAQEVVPSPSPYKTVQDELCVYVNTLTYLKSSDGAFYDIATSSELPEETLQTLKEDAILFQNTGMENATYESVTIYYESRNKKSAALCYQAPQYCATASANLTGSCAAVAGMNLIGYFDRYYEDLIPDHEAGHFLTADYYCYNYTDQNVINAIVDLYNDMNGSEDGITESNFKSGMKKYCARKNLQCDFSSLLSWGKLNFDAVKQSIADNKPIALLLSTYNVCKMGMDTDQTYEMYSYGLYPGNHVMAGFSWREVTYTHADGSTEVCRLIGVSTGWGNPMAGHFNIDYHNKINGAYSVNIY